MTVSYSTTIKNARLDAVESAIGTSPLLKLWTGSLPATLATADSTTLVASMTLPSDWMNAASGASKTLLGTWQDLLADATGTVGYFRIYDSSGTTAHIQGSVSLPAGGGDMTLINTSVTINQPISITTFTLTEP